MTLVYNYKDDAIVAAFVSGLKVTHSFYKHLVKHEVTKMRTSSPAYRSTFKLRMSPKFLPTAPQVRGQIEEIEGPACPSKKTLSRPVGAVNKSSQNLAKSHGDEADPTLFKILMDQVYNAIKG